jgi:hypothetical protein
MWNREQIKIALQLRDVAVERGILAIYRRQTLDEMQSEETKHHNGIGFSAAHARLGSYYAQWLLKGNHLSGKHLIKARGIILHYVGQLEEIVHEKHR